MKKNIPRRKYDIIENVLQNVFNVKYFAAKL